MPVPGGDLYHWEKRLISLRRNFWVVVALLIASGGAAAIWGTPIYYRLVYLWGLVIVLSYLWTYHSLRGISFTRQARTERQQVGQIFEERFELANPGRISRLWIAVRDTSELPASSGSRLMTQVSARQERSYQAYTWLTRRGLFNLGPTRLESGDIFGLFQSSREYPNTQSLLVTPYLVDLHEFIVPAGLLPGGKTLHRRTLEVTPYAASVREYAAGDPLSRIHWPSTARRDRLMVKEFEQDPQADIWIFVDAQEAAQAALPDPASELAQGEKFWLWRHRPDEVTLPPATIEYSVSVAASISNYFIQKGRAVGLVIAGQAYTVLPAERGERQLGKILETLAFIQPEGHLPLMGLTTTQAGSLPRGSTVILITPSIQRSVVAAVEDLTRRNLHPVIILLDAESFGGTPGTLDLKNQIIEIGIQPVVIENGQDLRSSLELGRQSVNRLPDLWTESAKVSGNAEVGRGK